MINRGYKLIETSEELQNLVQKLNQSDWIAVDTESDSMYHYHYKICLIQVSEGTFDWLIDPIVLSDLSSLFESFSKKSLILHGADYDLRMMRDGYSFQPTKIFDTMIAAQYLGYPRIGLGNLVEHFFGIKLNKTDQKANWSMRPLTDSMKTYAALDTRFLHEMKEKLTQELKEKNRLHWLEQACDRLIQNTFLPPRVPDTERNWRVKGSGSLNPKQLGILRLLWQWRENSASQLNRPPFQVMNNEKMIHLSETFSHTKEPDFKKMGHTSKLIQGTFMDSLQQAIFQGINLKENELPPKKAPKPPRTPTPNVQKLEKLKQWRDSQAHKLKIEPTLIANRHKLVALALSKKSDINDLLQTTELLPWQLEILLPGLQ